MKKKSKIKLNSRKLNSKKRNPHKGISLEFRPQKLEDLSKVFGKHWRKLWTEIKLQTESRIQKPKSIWIKDYPFKLYPHDYELCMRFAFDLESGEVSEGLHVSSGEWAAHPGSNNDELVNDLPKNVLIVNVLWSDFQRYMSFEVQAPVGSLPNQIT